MSFLKLENISKRCCDKWVLRDVSLEIERGEIFGILGSSGAGKSVLLGILSGLETPDAGTFFLSDEVTSRISPEKYGIYSVFQTDDLNLRKTVSENVAVGFKSRKISKEEINRETSLILNLFKLAEADTKRAADLSHGEKQLTALAKSIAAKPNILLLDSPLNFLDYQRREKALNSLKNWAKETGTTVIYATQNQDEAFIFCDRAAILSKGEILQTDSLMEIYAEPKTVAVAAFLGRNNLIRAGRLTSSKAALSEFQTVGGDHRLLVDNVEKSRLGAINQTVTLMIRPENLILTFGAAFPEDNLLKAEITEIKRLGATTRILLDAQGLKLEAQVIRLIGLNVGDTCMVGLPPNRIKVLKN